MVVSALGKRARSATSEPASPRKPPLKRARRAAMIIEDSDDESGGQDNPLPPVTPSKPVRTWTLSSARKPLTPRTPRFRDTSEPASSPRVVDSAPIALSTPRTPTTPSSIRTVYHLARQLFSKGGEPSLMLVGRDQERQQIKEFLNRCRNQNRGGCLYVSGPPGTGKSAFVREAVREIMHVEHEVLDRTRYINCMSINSTKDLFAALNTALCGPTLSRDAASADIATLKALCFRRKKCEETIIVVLDEVDNLLTLDSTSVSSIFDVALHRTSRLALIGIANALDLTDRFVPQLTSRKLKPELLPFLPYSATQIKEILTARLQSLVPKPSTKEAGFIPFFHPAALELCSRKVASSSGDLRRAFEICLRSIDLVESAVKQEHENNLREVLIEKSPSRASNIRQRLIDSRKPPSCSSSAVWAKLVKSLEELTVETAPRVSVGHLNKVTAAAFSVGPSQRLKTLNLQQKAALCSLLALERQLKSVPPLTQKSTVSLAKPAPTIKLLYQCYSKICSWEEIIHPLSSSEFREIVGSLEALAIISAVDEHAGALTKVKSTPRRSSRRNPGVAHADDKRVVSLVSAADMEKALQGPGSDILSRILHDKVKLD